MVGGGGNTYFPSGKAADTSAALLRHLDRRQVEKVAFEGLESSCSQVPVTQLVFIPNYAQITRGPRLSFKSLFTQQTLSKTRASRFFFRLSWSLVHL